MHISSFYDTLLSKQFNFCITNDSAFEVEVSNHAFTRYMAREIYVPSPTYIGGQSKIRNYVLREKELYVLHKTQSGVLLTHIEEKLDEELLVHLPDTVVDPGERKDKLQDATIKQISTYQSIVSENHSTNHSGITNYTS